ncbi:hypothetical protein QJS10_CPA08g01907 [Acorus calamus]|uniref:Transmembrane 9 superfamily member n=1 Tax=Acorus calamus TaxID=4465 RepID=A0AAV9ED37_ACOCL|nr:hypothetical protein QJS10_CPA08g01907 [Acorus calamus]
MATWADLVCPILLFLLLLPASAFYLPESYMHTYSTGDEISVKVNSLTSIEAELPFSYYNLPYCRPDEGIKTSTENLGHLLMGDQIVNSPYRFKVNVNESLYLCTTNPLSEHDVKLLKQRTRDLYQVNMILDNLPVMRYTQQKGGVVIQWTGFPVGFTPYGGFEDYIINHLKLKVLVHENEGSGVEINGTVDGYEIVGFEVVPCSVKRDSEVVSKLNKYDKIDSVGCPLELEKSQIIREGEKVSFTYEVEFVPSDVRWPSRWDVYLKMDGARVHWFSILYSLMVIFFLAGTLFVIFLGCGGTSRALGFMSPASRGMLLTGMIFLYLFFGIAAGYVGVRLWRTIKGTSEGWRSLSWSISCFFPGIVFAILTVLNFILWGSKSTGAIPISTYFMLILLWFCFSVPLTLLGGFFGTRAEEIAYPVRTNRIPREIPPRKFPSFPSALFLLVTVCAGVSVVLTYMRLWVEDWRWWWKAFFASGSVALLGKNGPLKVLISLYKSG